MIETASQGAFVDTIAAFGQDAVRGEDDTLVRAGRGWDQGQKPTKYRNVAVAKAKADTARSNKVKQRPADIGAVRFRLLAMRVLHACRPCTPGVRAHGR